MKRTPNSHWLIEARQHLDKGELFDLPLDKAKEEFFAEVLSAVSRSEERIEKHTKKDGIAKRVSLEKFVLITVDQKLPEIMTVEEATIVRTVVYQLAEMMVGTMGCLASFGLGIEDIPNEKKNQIHNNLVEVLGFVHELQVDLIKALKNHYKY